MSSPLYQLPIVPAIPSPEKSETKKPALATLAQDIITQAIPFGSPLTR